MKIVHLHELDGETGCSGAVISMNRLHHGLKDRGIDSKIICKRKSPGFQDAIEIRRPALVKVVERMMGWVTINLGLNCLNNIGCLKILRMPEFQQADLIHMHGMNGGFFSYLILPLLAKRKPIVYSLHDMFTYTGHCTTSLECERWRIGCGQCQHPGAYPPIKRDNTKLEWKLKRQVFLRSKPNIITISEIQYNQVCRSLLAQCPICTIPHGLDTNLYHPIDREACRFQLGLPRERKVILFCASDMMRYGKGNDLLEKALIALPGDLKEQITLLTIGLGGQKIADRIGMPSVNLGYVAKAEQMAALYSAADLFVMPSRQESFGLVTLESMACGTPVVSFNVGISPEIVRTNDTGYLAESENAEDLARGIVDLLRDESRLREMGKRCRQLVVREYNRALWIDRHISLYTDILNRRLGDTCETTATLAPKTAGSVAGCGSLQRVERARGTGNDRKSFSHFPCPEQHRQENHMAASTWNELLVGCRQEKTSGNSIRSAVRIFLRGKMEIAASGSPAMISW